MSNIPALLTSVRGPVLFPDDAGFADEAAVFNTVVTHEPHVIIGATHATDVQAAVRFAAEEGRSVAVLNSGHGPSLPVSGEAVLITTRRMTRVTVDSVRRTARVEAGVTWGQVVEAAANVGLAPLAGSSPQVGVVGYTLGGGVSIALGRAFGYAADHVRAVDLVTADGELRHVTPASDPDLFAALLGGKGNFGVVTALEFSLFPVAEVYAGSLQYAGEDAAAVLAAYGSLAATAPDALTSSIIFLRAPDLPFVPESMRGKLSIFVRVAYPGPAVDGEALIAPLRAAAPVLADTVTMLPVGQIASIANDPTDPATGVEHFVLLDELTPSMMDTILAYAGPDSDGSLTLVNLTQLGGAFATPPQPPNAVRRDVAFALLALTFVPPGAPVNQQEAGSALTGRLGDKRHPGYLSPADASVDGVRAAYDEATYERLRTVKTTWDPGNMFRWTFNIPPRT
ncbi:berberine-like enzyme [Asanoa ferruginea]|uniref:Berberine-like enzyme n=1 Tax=Asanoa ferruginea TaxID=53367 RepID=A0A3D9ZTE8_9ACTN|nr:FAD-dependent oxidoreductase [Asanoa ferruginea]REG00532.1 berberine-like enzyme [Asanoa ferruginea]GIF47695.1 oxidoreductase [Asanoa ferruginea]